MLISFAVICAFVFAYAKSWFSHNVAHMMMLFLRLYPRRLQGLGLIWGNNLILLKFNFIMQMQDHNYIFIRGLIKSISNWLIYILFILLYFDFNYFLSEKPWCYVTSDLGLHQDPWLLPVKSPICQ